MELNDAQKQAVAKWLAEKKGIGEIQKLLAEQFSLSLTYMDVRLLLVDLNLQVKDKEIPKHTSADLAAPAGPGKGKPATPDAFAMPGEPETAGVGVSISVDQIIKPGAIASGSVTFRNGVTASWALDDFGRLAIDAGRKGHRPSQEELQEFQLKLSQELQRRGF